MQQADQVAGYFNRLGASLLTAKHHSQQVPGDVGLEITKCVYLKIYFFYNCLLQKRTFYYKWIRFARLASDFELKSRQNILNLLKISQKWWKNSI